MKYKLAIPTSLKEIKLKQYQQFLKVASDNDNEDFLQQKAIQIFCGVPLIYVSQMKQKDVNDIANKIIALFSQKPKLINRFKIGDLEFGFIPNLDEMTSGEYIDLDSYISNWQEMHKAMAVLYRPITEKQKDKYSIEPYVSSINYAEVMEQMPLEVALSATVFFWTLGIDLLKSTKNYLEKDKAAMNILKQHNLDKNGAGILQSMDLLKATLEDLMR